MAQVPWTQIGFPSPRRARWRRAALLLFAGSILGGALYDRVWAARHTLPIIEKLDPCGSDPPSFAAPAHSLIPRGSPQCYPPSTEVTPSLGGTSSPSSTPSPL